MKRRPIVVVLVTLAVAFLLTSCNEQEGIASISADGPTTCSLQSDGTVRCWGNGMYGGLGDGPDVSATRPVKVEPITDAIQVANSGGFACALLAGGSVRCWGAQFYGQLGDGVGGLDPGLWSGVPTHVYGITSAIRISAGGSHACALLADGTVRCWGRNEDGQLGAGRVTPYSVRPATVQGLADVVDIAAGGAHTCALLADSTVSCWGKNDFGQIGDGTITTNTDRLVPTTVVGLTDVVDIDSAGSYTCALLADGTGRCWGGNAFGQLGDGTNTNRPEPVVVVGLADASAINPGGAHTCALLEDGTAACWGRNHYGQVGDGTTYMRMTPTAVTGVTGITAISAGSSHTCVALTGAKAKCWGYNYNGQLGNGTTAHTVTPGPVLKPTIVGNIVQASPSSDHGCALFGNGTVSCWGDNAYGQLGDGTTTDRLAPGAVPGLVDVTAVGTGSTHSCALRTDGTVMCWGRNNRGQLGDGTTTDRSAPTQVSDITTAIYLSLGSAHTCAVLQDGTARCWGVNNDGQLGDGTTTSNATPVPVTGLTGATTIAAATLHTCALLADGTVNCWGAGGTLGDGTATPRPTPGPVTDLTDATAITASSGNTCALLADRTAACWGGNSYGRLGDGTTTNRLTPVPVVGLTDITSIAARYSNTCAVLADGTARCWGHSGDFAGLGSDLVDDQYTPVPVPGITSATAIAPGGTGSNACVVLADHTARCWGRGLQGSLGDGTLGPRTFPGPIVSQR